VFIWKCHSLSDVGPSWNIISPFSTCHFFSHLSNLNGISKILLKLFLKSYPTRSWGNFLYSCSWPLCFLRNSFLMIFFTYLFSSLGHDFFEVPYLHNPVSNQVSSGLLTLHEWMNINEIICGKRFNLIFK
jgi:hypothetical protein